MKAFLVVAMVMVMLPLSGYAQDCKSGYPHVPMKNGQLDARNQDLWEIAQDWVHFRNMILRCNARGDSKCVAKYQDWFKKANLWIEAYSEHHSEKALSLAEKCR